MGISFFFNIEINKSIFQFQDAGVTNRGENKYFIIIIHTKSCEKQHRYFLFAVVNIVICISSILYIQVVHKKVILKVVNETRTSTKRHLQQETNIFCIEPTNTNLSI